MTTGEQGRAAPDAEHYLDLSDVAEESSGPHFDVVRRGYDRRQVDEHVAGLRRMVAQLRAQLAVRERRRGTTGSIEGSLSATVPQARLPATPPEGSSSAAGPAGGASGSGASGGGADVVGAFNDRLRGILAAAEQEAQMVRSRAAESLLAEHAESRAALADLRAQRDAVFDELVRTRNRIDDLVARSGHSSAPPSAPRGPWGTPPGPVPSRGPFGPPSGAFGPNGPGGPAADRDPDADGAGTNGAGVTRADVEADTVSDTGPSLESASLGSMAVETPDEGGSGRR